MIDFKTLETFLWVVRLGSFHGAAKKLHTTQPAISQRIAQLELAFGVKLLARESRNATPTQTGRQLLGYAERLLGLRAEMIANVRNPAAMRGVLRMGVSETIVHTWLPRFIQEVKARYPALSLEIEVDISPTLQARLLAQEIDLAFMLGPVSAPQVRNKLLCTNQIVFVASPALGVPNPASLADLAKFSIITFPRKSQPYEVVKALFDGFANSHAGRGDHAPLNLNTSASLGTVRLLAQEGLGVAVVPREIVQGELLSGALELITTDIVVPDLTFVAAYLSAPDNFIVERLSEIASEIATEDFHDV